VRATVIFDNLGPYHWARLCAGARVSTLTAIQVSERSAEYPWENESRTESFDLVTLLAQGTTRDVSARQVVRRMRAALDHSRPEVVFIPGWSSRAALAALEWCSRCEVPAVVMSESTAWDEKRGQWKETIKRRLMTLYSTALVGGQPHADNVVRLGLPSDQVFCGYDAVDNDYFSQKTKEILSLGSETRSRHGLPKNYFLASARFVEKKNLPRLLQAYAWYRAQHEKSKTESPSTGSSLPWSLVLLGDGPLRKTILAQIAELNLQNHVLLPGFKQYPDLPVYYALANAFVHASTIEPWGLVVNEAMASGLPVLVSNRCGCATDLVQEGKNGFTFDPGNVEDLAQLMTKLSSSNFPLSEFGAMSRQIIENWGPERFALGMKTAAQRALQVGPKRTGFFDRLLLKTLIRR
jgi:1,2-diacylglycerol 3-alpha-glucosyltransferase